MTELDAKLRNDLGRYLPADILNDLPERQATRKAIQHLGSLYTSVGSFLPQYILEIIEIAQSNKETHLRYGELRPGTFMFADVSGFTALSEQLQARGGSEGVEILTQIINDYFSTMLEIIAKSDGQLLKFAGDALLAFFPERQNERMDEAEKAIRTGLRMQRSMQEKFQPIQNALLDELFTDHNLELTMSIGISRGRLFEALVGSVAQRDHVLQGRLPGLAQDAEEAGERDDVIIDFDLCEKFKDKFTMREVADGFFQVVDDLGDELGDFEFHVPRRRRATAGSLFNLVDTDPIDELRAELTRVQTVAVYVAKEIVSKLAMTTDHVLSENRPSTVIFSHVTGFAELLEAWGDDGVNEVVTFLERFYISVNNILLSYGGVLTRTDPYKDGFKMLMTFGAPIAHPDDPQRAVSTALEMAEFVQQFNERLREDIPKHLHHMFPFVNQRFGITHGQVFAGEAGWRARREYTVMGDDVNLAARLMAKAPYGEIFVSQRVYNRLGDAFEVETLEPMALKGKANIIQAYRILRPRMDANDQPTTSDTPYIGHDLLMLSLTAMLNRAQRQNIRGAVALIADAGTGKTRTAQQLAKHAESIGFKVAWTSCQTHHESQTDWSNLLAQLLDIDMTLPETERRAKFDAEIERLNLQTVRTPLADLMKDYIGGGSASVRRATEEIKVATTSNAEAPAPKKSIFDIAKINANIEDETSQHTVTPPTGVFNLGKHLTPPGIKMGKEGPELVDILRRKISLDGAVAAFLQAYSNQNQPTMLVIDDIHAMNQYTMQMLKHIVDEVTDAPLVVFSTTEPHASLPERMPQMALTDLTEEDTSLMAMKILKANTLAPTLGEFLWERSHGRPFYIESLIQALRMNEQVEVVNGQATLRANANVDALPDSIRELIISRIDRLNNEWQEILKLAAVLDMPFTADTMLILAERTNLATLEEELYQLDQLQILEKLPDDTYIFRHGVTQRTLYQSLSRYHRQKLHRTIAEYWERQDHAERHLLIIAHHHARAGAMMRALEMISSAAAEAEEAKQLDRAIELYTRAQEIIPNDETITMQLERLQNLKEGATS